VRILAQRLQPGELRIQSPRLGHMLLLQSSPGIPVI
jgi:hypothetical protein